MTLPFHELLPGDRVMLPLRHDVARSGPYLIRSTVEFHDGTWELTYAHVGGVVTRRFSAPSAQRGALYAPTEEAA